MNRLLPYGDRAVLIEVADAIEALGLYRAITELTAPADDAEWPARAAQSSELSGAGTDGAVSMGLAGVVEVVPAARTVLVTFASPAACLAARPTLATLAPTTVDDGPREVVTIPVVYDGDDLAEVATLTGLSAEEVVARHTGSEFTVAFIGFAPGFAYLTGLDPALVVPRRESPRTRVPAGSVAIAADYAAVYPTASPGGWRLLGRTDLPIFDVHRDPPALLRPGMRVRFERVDR